MMERLRAAAARHANSWLRAAGIVCRVGGPIAACLLLAMLAVSGCAFFEPGGGIGTPPAAEPVVAEDPATAEVVGNVRTYRIVGDETLLDIAVEQDLGYLQIIAANPGVDPWLPGQGRDIVIPAARIVPRARREGLLINLPERRLYAFESGRLIGDFPVGIGRDGYETPRGSTRVVRRRINPTWYPTPSARRDDPRLPAAVHPGPDNPLGTRALDLGWPRYLIHGTNKPFGIGRRASRGCIRMYDADIVSLFDRVPVGTPVRVIDQPVKVGWRGDRLWLEAHPTIGQGARLEEDGRLPAAPATDARPLLLAKLGPIGDAAIDWQAVERILRDRRGVAEPITGKILPPGPQLIEARVQPSAVPGTVQDVPTGDPLPAGRR